MLTDNEKAYLDRADMILDTLEDWAKTKYAFPADLYGTAQAEGFRKAQETVAKMVKKRYDA